MMRRWRRACLGSCLTLALSATPAWKVPEQLPFGELSVLEIAEQDPALPPLPRPGEERLGPLELRGVEPTPDGRGWRLTVQPMVPGLAVIPPLDLGDGRQAPELRIPVPRSVPYQAPWMGVGGGREDALPYLPFPWAWASLLLLPPAALGAWAWRRWRRGLPARLRHHAQREFARHWPPPAADRPALDAAHACGRNLLAAHFGEDARSWGWQDFESHCLAPWSLWVRSLDAARFSRSTPAFPPLADLLKSLEERR